MLNPASDKYTLEFGSSFFPSEYTKKYDDFLYMKNGPIKDIQTHITESVQSLSIPGINLDIQRANGINNLGKNLFQGGNYNNPTSNIQYPGTAPLSEIIDGTSVNITFRNTTMNWMYFYEALRGFYSRKRTITDFTIILTVKDAGEIDMLQFIFGGCFVATMPGLEFAFSKGFREAETIDAGFAFQTMDVKFVIPQFDVA
jgi:hypothetical protein